MRYYLDANVFLYALLYSGPPAEGARRLLRRIGSGRDSGVSASLCVDEVVWGLWRETGDRGRAVAEGQNLFLLPNFSLVEVGTAEIRGALDCMGKYPRLKPRNAIHLACCTARGIRQLVSDDADFDGIAEVKRVPLEALRP